MADEFTTGRETVETTEDFPEGDEGIVKRWKAEINAYQGAYSTWTKRSSKVLKRYRDESITTNEMVEADDEIFKTKNFNIFWSNIQILQPALFAKMPNVLVKRRNRDGDPPALAGVEILKRSIEFQDDFCDYEDAFKDARDDYLLTARGQVWIRYEPTFGDEVKGDLVLEGDADNGFITPDGEPLDEALLSTVLTGDDQVSYAPGAGEPYSPVVDEKVYIDHIYWGDFGHTVAPRWNKVTAVWRRSELTRDQLIERFGKEKADKVNLTKRVKTVSEEVAAQFGDVFKRAVVYEIWDKITRKVYWISDGCDETLDIKDDPLRLLGFFPCPKPLYGTTTTDSLQPVPDYIEYQAQALQLDILTQRIDRLTEAMRVVGAYNGEFPQLERLVKGDENSLIAVDNWAMFAEQGGLPGAISFLPIKEVADALFRLIQVREQVKADLYEVTGMSDLVRGQSDAGATATAERIKGQFVSLRIKSRQRDMARFVRDAIGIVAEILGEHFSTERLLNISGWLESSNARALGDRAPIVAEQAVQMLKDDRERSFNIDIETDDTIIEDVERERQGKIEFLQASTAFLQQAVPAAQENPALGPLLAEMLMFGVKAFQKGTELEEIFEQTIENLRDPAAQQRPDPEGEARQAEAQLKGQELQAKLAHDQGTLQLKQQEQQFDQQLKQQQQQFDQLHKQHEREVQIQEIQLRARELEIKLEEIAQRREDSERRFEIEMHKLRDAQVGRATERERQLQDRDEDRQQALDDRNAEQEHDLVMRHLDNLLAPTESTTAGANDNDATKTMVTSITKLVDLQEKAREDIARLLSAPRKLIRNAETREIEGSVIDG